MKIAIIAHPLYTNYGGILQAYALQTVLERMGHEVEVINRDMLIPLPPLWKRPLSYGKRILKKLLGKPSEVFWENRHNRDYYIIGKQTRHFIDSHIHVHYILNHNDIQNKYDAIVVGSDQVWRPKYIKYLWREPTEFAFLNFAKKWGIKRMAYAASFGVDEWEFSEEETCNCKNLISLFDAVSVRERSGIELCRKYLDVNATHVLDPTMLLSQADYESLIDEITVKQSKGTLDCYVLDKSPVVEDIISAIADKRGLTRFDSNGKMNHYSLPVNLRIQPPVEQWLKGFKDAEMVITDSFHACVFSILFEKQFIVVGNKDRGMARFISLLNMFGLENRMVNSPDEALSLDPIDYKCVNEKLKAMREVSMDYLRNALS